MDLNLRLELNVWVCGMHVQMINSKFVEQMQVSFDSSNDEIQRFVYWYVQNVVESCTSRLVLISVAVGAAGTGKMDPAWYEMNE